AAPNEKSKENEPGGEETGLKDTKDAVVPKKKAYAPTPYGIAKIEFFAKWNDSEERAEVIRSMPYAEAKKRRYLK
ncbi:unnamed protein product, partial [Durusdinium trenchii]